MTRAEQTVFETDGIIRIHLKFDIIKTCVFLVKNENDHTLIDCGLNEITTRQQLIPALKDLQIPLDSVKTVLISHAHDDHSGGLPSLLEFIPNARIFADRQLTESTRPLSDGLRFEQLQAVHLPGHTLDSYGFFDLRTNSLISADALQLFGIGKFGVNTESPEKYLESHEKLLKMPIENIFSSHCYDFLGIRATGRRASLNYIKESKENFNTLVEFVENNMKYTNDAKMLSEMFESTHVNYPRMQPYTIEQIIKYLRQ